MGLGQLLLPSIIIDWGEISLGRLFYGVSMGLRGENEGHDLSFSFEPSQRGYELYRRCTAETNRPKPILITIGYVGGKSITGEFLYAGVSMGSGASPEITVNAMSNSVARLNRFRLNKTYGDGTSELNLSKLVELEGANRSVVIDTSQVGKVGVTHTPIVGETTAEFVTREMTSRGFGLAVSPAPSVSGADIEVVPPYASEAGQKQVEEAGSGVSEENVSTDSKRRAYIIGLTAIEDFARTIRYSPSKESDDTTASSSISTSATPDVKDDETVEESAPSLENEQDSTSDPTGSSEEPSTSPDSSLDTPETSTDADIADAQTESFKENVRECSGTIVMNPRLTGLRPRDFILLPSLEQGSGFVEDWLVTSVSYAQESGGVKLSFTGKRWQKDEPMVTNYEALANRADTLTNVDSWESYYWIR